MTRTFDQNRRIDPKGGGSMKTETQKLKYIEKARLTELGKIDVAQHRLAELNTQRQNIIMED